MYCINCGVLAADEAAYCVKCGKPISAPPIKTEPSDVGPKTKTDKLLVVGMAVTWLVSGIISPHFQGIVAVQVLVFAILLFSWCKAHAAKNSIEPPAGAPVLVAIFALIGVPYYFFRGYGWRKGSVLLLIAVGMFIVFDVLYIIGFALSQPAGT